MILILLALHILGDYTYQTDRMAKYKSHAFEVMSYLLRRKKHPLDMNKIRFSIPALFQHVLIYTAFFIPAVLLGAFSWWGLLVIFGTHLIIDSRRWVTRSWAPATILTDQAFHLLVLGLLLFIN